MMRARPRPENWLVALLGAPAGALAAYNVKLAVGAVAAVVVGILMLVGAEYLLLGVVAVEPWTDALNFPHSFTIPKIVGFLAVSSWGLAAVTGRARLRFTPQMGWGFAFLAVIIISDVLAPVPSQSTSTTISYALYVLFLGLFVQSIRTSGEVERCLGVYVLSIIAGTFYGLGTFTAGVAHLASGPIGDPNNYASTLAGGLPIALYFSVHARRWRWLWRIGGLLIVATLLATLSRGALVGFAVVLVWGATSGRISFNVIAAIAVAVAVGIGVGFVFFKPVIDEHLQEKSAIATTNVTSREAFWTAALKMAENNPLVGIGPGRFPYEAPNYILNNPSTLVNPVAHESYLEILAEDGIFALALYLIFLCSSWRALRAARALAQRAQDRRGVHLADALMASFLWTCVTMLFITRALAIPLFLFSGLAGSLVLARRGETADPTLQPASPALPPLSGEPLPSA